MESNDTGNLGGRAISGIIRLRHRSCGPRASIRGWRNECSDSDNGFSFSTTIDKQDTQEYSIAFCILQGIGLGSVIAGAVHFSLDIGSLNNWGWRLPFLAGIFIGLISLYLQVTDFSC